MIDLLAFANGHLAVDVAATAKQYLRDEGADKSASVSTYLNDARRDGLEGYDKRFFRCERSEEYGQS